MITSGSRLGVGDAEEEEEHNVMLNIFIGILKQRKRKERDRDTHTGHMHTYNIHAKRDYKLIEYDYLRYTDIMKECRDEDENCCECPIKKI